MSGLFYVLNLKFSQKTPTFPTVTTVHRGYVKCYIFSGLQAEQQ